MIKLDEIFKVNGKYEWYCMKCGSVKIEKKEINLFNNGVKISGTGKYKNL
jgi:predicted nucleic-acid-binding Zn-ribbon protein